MIKKAQSTNSAAEEIFEDIVGHRESTSFLITEPKDFTLLQQGWLKRNFEAGGERPSKLLHDAGSGP